MAVEAQKVKADLNATMTLDIASKVLKKVVKNSIIVLCARGAFHPLLGHHKLGIYKFCAGQIQEEPHFLCVQKRFTLWIK